MKMSVSKALRLRAGLQSCDGHEVTAKDGEQERVITKLYDLSFDTRYLIAKNLDALEAVSETYNKMRNGAIKECSKNGVAIDPRNDPAGAAEFAARDQEYLDKEVEIELDVLAKDSLKSAGLPAGVMAAIMPIVTD